MKYKCKGKEVRSEGYYFGHDDSHIADALPYTLQDHVTSLKHNYVT